MATQDCIISSSYLDIDDASLELLIRKHEKDIYRFIRSKVFDESLCDDILQDALIKIVEAIKSHKYVDNKKFLSWAMRISHNLIIDHLRNSKKLKKYTPIDAETDVFLNLKDDSPSAENRIAIEETTESIKSLIEKLPKEQKEIVKMRYYEDLSFKKIAEKQNININTATARMRYAILHLRTRIDGRRSSVML